MASALENQSVGVKVEKSEFSLGEKCLGFHGPIPYEVKIIKMDHDGTGWKYLVHYIGWNKKYDETIDSTRILKYTPENLIIKDNLLKANSFTTSSSKAKTSKVKKEAIRNRNKSGSGSTQSSSAKQNLIKNETRTRNPSASSTSTISSSVTSRSNRKKEINLKGKVENRKRRSSSSSSSTRSSSAPPSGHNAKKEAKIRRVSGSSTSGSIRSTSVPIRDKNKSGAKEGRSRKESGTSSTQSYNDSIPPSPHSYIKKEKKTIESGKFEREPRLLLKIKKEESDSKITYSTSKDKKKSKTYSTIKIDTNGNSRTSSDDGSISKVSLPKHSCSYTAGREPPTKKRRGNQLEAYSCVESDDKFNAKQVVKFHVTEQVKIILCDDRDYIINQKKVVKLPAKHTVMTLLQDFKKQYPCAPDNVSLLKRLNDFLDGVRDYFNSAIGSHLCYSFERLQYGEILRERGKRGEVQDLTDVYGLIHLLRLFTRIGNSMAFTKTPEKHIIIIQKFSKEFMMFIVKNKKTYYDPNYDYEMTTPEYQRRALQMR